MKLRTSKLRIWIRMAIARRALRRVELQLKQQAIAYQERESALIERYELALATERNNVQLLHKEWADRFLQLNKLQPMFVDNNEVSSPRISSPNTSTSNLEETMDYDTRQLYLDRKDQFWEDGEADNFSPAEIKARWEQIKNEVIMDVSGAMK